MITDICTLLAEYTIFNIQYNWTHGLGQVILLRIGLVTN